ncbi:hypothetical protein [Pseudotamlana agarivorans]|uniref:hypothetical protein n=1 Tax=Pseudotamlana agarivorans TaxID=481183 RepID=UPI0012F85FD7|nr:hypothetical protein [Tamlana agarivorans]
MSPEAYSKKISEDFNYLLLGENSPNQGISAILNDDKSSLKINGLLYTGKYGVLNIEADLKASNGIYFFDQENGSEQGKITFNYYKPVIRWSEFYSINDFTKANIKLQTLELITQAKSDFEGLEELVKEVLGEEVKEDNNAIIKKLKKLSEKYINEDDAIGFHKLEERKFDKSSYYLKSGEPSEKTEKEATQIIIKDGIDSKKDLIIKNKDKKNITKILRDYAAKKKFILRKLEDSINKLELESVKSQWAGNHIIFMGVSPFYERQSFKRFLYDNSKTFSDMFTNERGNVYGITLSLNYSLEKGKGSRNIYKPKSLFLRLSTSLNRASNITNFKSSTLDISTPIGNDVNGNPIEFTNSDKAFIGDSEYEYGFGSTFSFEAYYYPFPVSVGVFGRIAYNNIKFNKGSVLDDIEEYPMRLGMLFSLKNKEGKKPLITIQAFLDRTDLNLSPNGTDNDLRFGLGIGLPINTK